MNDAVKALYKECDCPELAAFQKQVDKFTGDGDEPGVIEPGDLTYDLAHSFEAEFDDTTCISSDCQLADFFFDYSVAFCAGRKEGTEKAAGETVEDTSEGGAED